MYDNDVQWRKRWDEIKNTVPASDILEKAERFSRLSFPCIRVLEKEFDIDGEAVDMQIFIQSFDRW